MFVFVEFCVWRNVEVKHGSYNKATHQLNRRRDSAITLSTRPLDFDLCLRVGRVSEFQYREPQPITYPSPLPSIDYGTPHQIKQIESRERFVVELRRIYLDRMIVAGDGATL
ncbi:hypothetical protein J6590_093622 [Homalodisca vitripennis]|nr:hypothetical protein J6590_093622 [Homalodisca vitripennis]